MSQLWHTWVPWLKNVGSSKKQRERGFWISGLGPKFKKSILEPSLFSSLTFILVSLCYAISRKEEKVPLQWPTQVTTSVGRDLVCQLPPPPVTIVLFWWESLFSYYCFLRHFISALFFTFPFYAPSILLVFLLCSLCHSFF